ncbi:Uncharacterised protein [Bordetella pertussis]|nr:Uncharacterised protein [Bordetella pertussis]CRD96125.1 Uncharacterised protein [Bordetella pertussis]
MPSGTCRDSTSVSAGPQPRYGTCCNQAPLAWRSISPARCCGVPLPHEANASVRLCVSAWRSRSGRPASPAGSAVTITEGTYATLITAVKSRVGEKSRLRNTPGLTANELLTISSV